MSRLPYDRLLLSDTVGQDAYRRAIKQTLRGGEVVLDIGTGTGVHAIFACEAGASKVYAVEREDVIDLARRIVAANGYADRVCFIRGSLEEVELPERVDVIIGHHGLRDLFYLMPLARDRFLKKGGRIVPNRVDLYGAPVEVPHLYADQIEFWGAPRFGIDFSVVMPHAINRLHDCSVPVESLLGGGEKFASIELASVEAPRLRAVWERRVERKGILHGMVLWLTQQLADSVSCSNGPPSPYPQNLWPQAFFPIGEAVAVEPGYRISVTLQAAGPAWGSIWRWRVVVEDEGGAWRRIFDHSTVAGTILTRGQIERQSQGFCPKLSQNGQALRHVLAAFEEGASVGEIARELAAEKSGLFNHSDEAAEFVAKAVARYAQ